VLFVGENEMTNPQNYAAVFIPPVPIDTTGKVGVHYESKPEALVTPALSEIQRVMREIRATGKCGMAVIRWDGQAWNIHRCDPPARVNEA
jgi:hypothetical protein